jgi:hypothetical protein
MRSATLAKKERGVALNLSVKVATPLFVSLRAADESTEPREPTSIGKLSGLQLKGYITAWLLSILAAQTSVGFSYELALFLKLSMTTSFVRV